MRIGYSFLHFPPEYIGGVYTFVHGVLNGLLNVKHSHTIQVYVLEYNVKALEDYKKFHNLEIIGLPDSSILLKLIRRASLLFQQEAIFCYVNTLPKNVREMINRKSDILYIPTSFLYPTRLNIPTIVSIHDIQHFHYPQFFNLSTRLMRQTNSLTTFKVSGFIQASSQYIKDDILRYYSNVISSKQIFVVHEGVNIKEFQKGKGNINTLKKYNIPDQFLLYPAQLWHHKNHINLLKAIESIRDESGVIIPLVLTGFKAANGELVLHYIRQHKLDKQIYYLGSVPFNELLDLYKFSTYVISSSLHESSSLPLLEGAASGKPLIASNIPPNVEMSQNIKMTLFDPENTKDIAEKLLDCWLNKERGFNDAADNLKIIDQYSWYNVAKEYIRFFESTWK